MNGTKTSLDLSYWLNLRALLPLHNKIYLENHVTRTKISLLIEAKRYSCIT